jgi:hypothetical protein
MKTMISVRAIICFLGLYILTNVLNIFQLFVLGVVVVVEAVDKKGCLSP